LYVGYLVVSVAAAAGCVGTRLPTHILYTVEISEHDG